MTRRPRILRDCEGEIGHGFQTVAVSVGMGLNISCSVGPHSPIRAAILGRRYAKKSRIVCDLGPAPGTALSPVALLARDAASAIFLPGRMTGASQSARSGPFLRRHRVGGCRTASVGLPGLTRWAISPIGEIRLRPLRWRPDHPQPPVRRRICAVQRPFVN